MAVLRHVKNIRSNVVESDGLPKIPTSSNIDYGEIAINYSSGLETISLKNSSNGITKFTPNTNVLVKNILSPISNNTLKSILSVQNVYNHQDFNLSFLEEYDDEAFELTEIIEYITQQYYDVCDLHIILNVTTAPNSNFYFYINSEAIQDLVEQDNPISAKSVVMGFTSYGDGLYFVAGNSNGVNGIEINWDRTTKAVTVRFVYVDNVYRMNGDTMSAGE